MRAGWAIAAGLALGIALAYFVAAPAPPAQHARNGQPHDRAAAKPTHAAALYRWRNEAGVLQITDRPPKDRPYERVQLREDRNIVPMRGPAPEPPN